MSGTSPNNGVDCRHCVYGTDVVPGISVFCLKEKEQVGWAIATGTLDCGLFEQKTDAELAQAANIPGAPLKSSNPKDGVGATKLPLSLVPPTAIAMASLAHLDGALKYGKWNWRKAGVRASIYVDAARRHLSKWEDGDELDPDGVYHLGHALACINIIIDAQACGKLFDDRPPKVGLERFFSNLTGWVGKLTKKHVDKNPRHWTLADSDPLPVDADLVIFPKNEPTVAIKSGDAK